MAEKSVRRPAFLIAILFLIGGCGSFAYHQVRPGETLYSISWRYGQDYREVARWNRIDPPYTIHSGQRLRVAPLRTDSAAPAAAQAEPRPAAPAAPPSAAVEAAPAAAQAAPAWYWPVPGKVLRGFAPNASNGVDINGELGEPVRAAASGRVVYGGTGLPRYGRLVIIKHDERYLSAYAHSERLLVQEGDVVAAGQQIAEMGSSGTGANRVMLHFEIRRDGIPVDPLAYLPSR